MTQVLDRIILAVDRLWPLSGDRAAEARWRQHNAEAKARGCGCGKPATVVSRHYGTAGSVPFEWWTCADCAGCQGFRGNRPVWKHSEPCPLGDSRSSGGKIGGPTEWWGCTHKSHRAA